MLEGKLKLPVDVKVQNDGDTTSTVRRAWSDARAAVVAPRLIRHRAARPSPGAIPPRCVECALCVLRNLCLLRLNLTTTGATG